KDSAAQRIERCVAADAEQAGPRAVDAQAIVDGQLSGEESDVTLQATGEVDVIRAGVRICSENRLPQRTDTAVGKIQDKESRRQGSPLADFDLGDKTPGATLTSAPWAAVMG